MKKNLPNREIGALMLATCLALGGCEKARLDEQVRTLCAKDGGVTVYEIVALPPETYDRYVKANWILPERTEAKPIDDYYTETDLYYIKKGNPQLTRRQYKIIRRSDGKVLGESISYGRGGGDLPGPWHESSYHCPSEVGLGIETRVFHRGLK